jgi:hypothetical protein
MKTGKQSLAATYITLAHDTAKKTRWLKLERGLKSRGFVCSSDDVKMECDNAIATT